MSEEAIVPPAATRSLVQYGANGLVLGYIVFFFSFFLSRALEGLSRVYTVCFYLYLCMFDCVGGSDCMCFGECLYMCVPVYMRVCMNVSVFCICACMSIFLYVYLYLCVYVCVCRCMFFVFVSG